jgi:ATPase family associated with various cellular activities (AAA)
MWSQHGTRFNQFQKDNELDVLPVGIYTLEYAPFAPMYLNLKQPKFEFPYKLYGTNERFPERVIKKYKGSNANLGVLLCGLKGTGKTVEAELICNLSGLPVILVTQDYDKGADLIHFLSTVDQEVVVMIDEYEKIFGKADGLLSIMDGALNARQRRLFVLTANTPYISDAMIDRPSRIHYLKKYGNLSVAVINEVVDDMLENKAYREQVVEYMSVIDIVTIDIVKTIVAEVNLFNEPPQKFKNFLNVTMVDHAWWDLADSEGTVLMRFASSDMTNPFTKGYNLALREYGDHYTDFGCISSSNVKTGKIVTNKGTYTLTKSRSFSGVVETAAMRMGVEVGE